MNLGKQLSAVLERSIELHRDMLALAERKREVVLSGQIQALQDFLVEETGLLEQLEAVEQERLQCVRQIVPTAEDARHVTLSKLIRQMSEEERRVIQGQMRELLHLVEQLQQENDQNQSLVDESLQHVQHSLDVLMTHPIDDYTYRPQQQASTGINGSSGLFDRKA